MKIACIVPLWALLLTWPAFGQLRPPLSGAPCGGGAGWDFEDGTLQGWTVSGAAFQQQPMGGDIGVARVQPPGFTPAIATNVGGNYWNGYPWPNGHGGNYWVGSRDGASPAGPVDYSDAPIGTLTSPAFTIGSTFVTFLLGGGKTTLGRVELQILAQNATEAATLSGTPIMYTEPPPPSSPALARTEGLWVTLFVAISHVDGETLSRLAFLPTSYRGRTARLRVVDASASAHINADEFACVDRVPPPPDPVPLWGFADLHSGSVRRVGGDATLVPSVAGRLFEYNCDGLAHYGMLPDFFQDSRNSSVAAGAFQPLMRSAEDTIAMWEKSCRLAAAAGGGDACQ